MKNPENFHHESPRKRATVYTLGCRLNESESGIIQRKLKEANYEIVPFGEKVDLAVINTCTVTLKADSKCRNVIRSFIRKNHDAFTAVIGCYSEVGHKALSDIEGIDLIIGNQEKLGVLDYVKQGKNPSPVIIRDRILREDFSVDYKGGTVSTARANLKIQDGCDFVCSFCIIPRARGGARSRDFENLMGEATALVETGVKEIVLTGVNVGTYTSVGKTILDVIDALNDLTGLERLRISSIEPTTIPNGIFVRMNAPDHVLVPYLHVPMQSGSDHILKKMKRRYLASEFAGFVFEAHRSVSALCVGTDIMVGFPGETDQDFCRTEDLFRDSPVHYAHIFTYSQRDRTPASRDQEQVPDAVKKERRARLEHLNFRKKQAFYTDYLNREMPVLFESASDESWFGHTANFIPVVAASRENLRNQIRTVHLQNICGDHVEGRLISCSQASLNRLAG